MRGIIMIGDANLSIEKISKIQFDDYQTSFNRENVSVVLTTNKGGIYFDYAEEMPNYYDDDDIKKINSLGYDIKELIFITVDYSSKKVFYRIMQLLKDICLLVDDDHGKIISYDEYLKVLDLEVLSKPND